MGELKGLPDPQEAMECWGGLAEKCGRHVWETGRWRDEYPCEAAVGVGKALGWTVWRVVREVLGGKMRALVMGRDVWMAALGN